jgi:hypothetical protein
MRNRMILIASLIAILPTGAFATNYKKDFCGNKDYVGNTGSRYPHMHCGKSFMTLSRSSNDHINFNGRPNCNKVNEVLDDKQNQYGNASDPAAITAVLDSYKTAGCP